MLLDKLKNIKNIKIILFIALSIAFWWFQVTWGTQKNYPLWLSGLSAISTSTIGWFSMQYLKKRGII